MSHHLPFTITKMSGAGNTFAVIDARKDSSWLTAEGQLKISRSQFAKMVCDKVLGVCADGFLLIQTGSEGFDFDWDFYNSDGSGAEMCGNAARCAARYCYDKLGANKTGSLRFRTGAGLVVADILGSERIRVRMPEARVIDEAIELMTKSSSVEKFVLVNTGVPHLVQKIHTLADAPALKDMAQEVRSHHDLQPAGANVTFYAEEDKEKIKAITFERGVENYTLACGTGAVAAALVYGLENQCSQVEVEMPGGLLNISFIPGDAHPLMEGTAVFIGDFKYNLEVIE